MASLLFCFLMKSRDPGSLLLFACIFNLLSLFSISLGNEQMKAENFEAAVSFYGKAIELNPSNAVYFCNRYWLSLALHTCGFGPYFLHLKLLLAQNPLSKVL